ncbi:MAG: toll/interleukin-1 receptor domain-containing protein, partial [Geminicoccaceae bacterium]
MATELQTLVQTGEPPLVFVSYSHQDELWKNLLLPQLKQLVPLGDFEVWNDRDIKACVDWYAAIKNKLDRTKVAVCLISANFLNSSFCMDEEVSYLLQQRNKRDLEIIPVLVEGRVRKPHRWLKRLQMLPRDGKNVTTHFKDDPAQVFAMVSEQAHDMLQPGYSFKRPPPAGTPPEKIDIDRLPESDDLLFGRRLELNSLDSIWDEDSLKLAVFAASGGVGRSSLVRCWVEDMPLERSQIRLNHWDSQEVIPTRLGTNRFCPDSGGNRLELTFDIEKAGPGPTAGVDD